MASDGSRSPIIVIGMHRSGTALVSGLLEGLGAFMGWKKETNEEALFFLRLNEWILREAGASWDRPEPVQMLLENSQLRRLAADYARALLRSPRVLDYLGWARYLRYRSPERLPTAWGWKDPRTTFTLPLWLDLFPGSRVVHVYRHGVDVARSLEAREERFLAQTKALWERRRFPPWQRPENVRFAQSVRCASLDGGFSLWELYMDEARRHVAGLDEDHCLEIRYESLVSDPRAGVTRLARFCGLPLGDARRESLAAQPRAQRAYAFRSDPRARAFASKVADRLARFGYKETAAGSAAGSP